MSGELVPKQQFNRINHIPFIGCIILFLSISLGYIFFGRINADEGWYLYASKLVYTGLRPYQDFAYTQTPLLPYVYGLPQRVFHGLYTGRITSLAITLIALICSTRAAKNVGGRSAQLTTAFLWATFSYGIYFNSITKTYALTTLLFSLTFYVFCMDNARNKKMVWATIFVTLATLTRLSALFFALPILLYAFFSSKTQTKMLIIAFGSMGLLWMAWLSWPSLEAAQWNLLTHHASHWGELANSAKLQNILFARLPILFIYFSGYLLLGITLLLSGFKSISNFLQNYPTLSAYTTGLLTFTLPNLATGGFHTEYFVPLLFGLFPIFGICFSKVSAENKRHTLLTVILLSTGLLGLLMNGRQFIDTSGGQRPIEEIQSVSRLITEPGDLLALEGLWVAVESNRQTLPHLTMSQFSVIADETNHANELKLVNGEILLSYLEENQAQYVMFTDLDWKILDSTAQSDDIQIALNENYKLKFETTEFGQRKGSVQLFERIQPN